MSSSKANALGPLLHDPDWSSGGTHLTICLDGRLCEHLGNGKLRMGTGVPSKLLLKLVFRCLEPLQLDDITIAYMKICLQGDGWLC